jgi:hypothetical protein
MSKSKPFAIFNITYARFLLEWQNDLCYLCGRPVLKRPVKKASKEARDLYPIREHVNPKSNGHGRWGNTLISHNRCSNLKGDRRPYPCELIYLEAANLALKAAGLEAPSYGTGA